MRSGMNRLLTNIDLSLGLSLRRRARVRVTPLHDPSQPILDVLRTPDKPSMSHDSRESWRRADRSAIRNHQLTRLNRLLMQTVVDIPFYRDKYRDVDLPLESLDRLARLPLLEKRELTVDGVAPICGLPRQRYVRVHQTSGTTGKPLRLLDTPADWRWWLDCWQYVLDAAEVTDEDTAFMAFSYGPFIGFWTAHESMIARGAKVIPGGGMDSSSRLRMLTDCQASVLCCTPTYALHLASVAERQGIALDRCSVTRIIVAGEPGGSIPEVRQRIETAWGARLIDHSGATELGAWGVGTRDGGGVQVIESEFIAETLVFDAANPRGRPAQSGELAELILTGLGRFGSPAIRYRTGDLVKAVASDDPANRFVLLEGGIIGRADNMAVVRGVNVFPSSIEAIVRRVAGDAEYRVVLGERDAMAQLRVEIEGDDAEGSPSSGLTARLAAAFREDLGLRIDVIEVAPATLPRFEAKAKRWVRETELKTT